MTTFVAGGEWLVILPILCCGLPLLLVLFFGRRKGGGPKDETPSDDGGLNSLLNEENTFCEVFGYRSLGTDRSPGAPGVSWRKEGI